jgi:hypothetical protein
MLTITTTPDWLFEASALVYARWSHEYGILKATKAEKDDGSKDWQAFHKARLTRAIEQETIWRTRKDEASRLSALALPEVLSNPNYESTEPIEED